MRGFWKDLICEAWDDGWETGGYFVLGALIAMAVFFLLVAIFAATFLYIYLTV